MKDSFIIYKSFYKPLSKLSDKQLGRLFRIIFLYQLGEEVSIEEDLEMAFAFFKNQFEIDESKYQGKVERNACNGRKGGNPNFKKGVNNPYYGKIKENEKITEDNPTLPKITEDKPINDNDNDIKKESKLSKENDFFKNIKSQLLDSPIWVESQYRKYHLDEESLSKALDDFIDWIISIGEEESIGSASDAKRRFTYWSANVMSIRSPISIRKEAFKKAIRPFVYAYGKDLCNSFFNYWIEKDSAGIMRFEKEKVWEIDKRLEKWRNYEQSRFT